MSSITDLPNIPSTLSSRKKRSEKVIAGKSHCLYNENMELLEYKHTRWRSINEKINIDNEEMKLITKFLHNFYIKENFKYTRVDFYINKNKVYFGEFTFTPENCMGKYSKNFERVIYDKYII